MFFLILQRIPHSVWMLLALLIAIGISQSFTKRRSLRSATLIPIIMILLSLYGVMSVFAQASALLAWAVGVAAALTFAHAVGAWKNIRWSQADQRLIVPGSWMPMLLMLGLFFTKFGVNVALAMHHELVNSTGFAMMASLAYGVFSGTFFARGVAAWKAANHPTQWRTVG